jgi:hypothetical protein
VPGVMRSQDPLGAAEVLAQPVKSDPPIDQPQDVRVRVARFEQRLSEVDESPHRRLGIATSAPLLLVAFALRRAVRRAKRPVVDLQR